MSSSDAQASIEALLTDDHRKIDELFEQGQAGDQAALASLKERLRLHLRPTHPRAVLAGFTWSPYLGLQHPGLQREECQPWRHEPMQDML